MPDDRWILAFDASCGNCQAIAAAVQEAAAGRLDVVPLQNDKVTRWRHEALGADAPWRPTLLRVRGSVAAWTGPALVLPLVRTLGVRTTLAVLRSLGQLQQSSRPAAGLNRKQFLRLGAGAGMAAGILLTGRAPAFATGRAADIPAWIAANKDKLPRRYDEFTKLPMAYRKAVYGELSVAVRQELWLEQTRRYRAGARVVTREQAAALDEFEAFVRRGFEYPAEDFAGRDQFGELVNSAYEKREGKKLFRTLGPSDNAGMAPAGDCSCSTWDDWCDGTCWFRANNCTRTRFGCGDAWSYHCDGHCG
ncbi:bacteriocin fulvocin C-related protein [Kribbella sp. NPDC056345]|uniref:bacteriocin fulvocin C-related protein n=1 Tax=Kribbella sp. NPDC056345 TaxID=3345789 RepID=UPI0035D9C140